MNSETKVTTTDAKDAKQIAKSTPLQPESNESRPGPGFGQKSTNKHEFNFAYPSNPGHCFYVGPGGAVGRGRGGPVEPGLGAVGPRGWAAAVGP